MEQEKTDTILLIGASGFIGKNIGQQLGGTCTLLAPSHSEMDLMDSDAVSAYLSNHKVDSIIFAANIGGNRKQDDVSSVTEKNLTMFMNVAKHEGKFKKMVFLGSGAEYDKRQDLVLVKEEDFGKSIPIDEYGLAKYKISEYIASHKNIISLRCFSVYGKYEDADIRFISNCIRKAIKGEPLSIYQNVFFDFLWVNDLVSIIEYILRHPVKEKFYNACSGQRVDLLSIAELIKKISGKPLEIIVKQEGWAKEYTGSNSRLLAEIPKLHLTPLEEGIRLLFKYLS